MTNHPRPPHPVPLAHRIGAWVTWWVLLMSFWIILDDSIALDELLAGAGAAGLAAGHHRPGAAAHLA